MSPSFAITMMTSAPALISPHCPLPCVMLQLVRFTHQGKVLGEALDQRCLQEGSGWEGLALGREV